MKSRLGEEGIKQLLAEALAIETEDAKEAKALGYMARALTLATMPHSEQQEQEFTRTNGLFTLTMLARKAIGLPYEEKTRFGI